MANPPLTTSRTSPRTAPHRATAPSAPRTESRALLTRFSLGKVFAAESRDYLLLLGATLFLVLFGLVMVLSSSSVTSYASNEGSFARFSRQLIFAVVGVPIMIAASRMPPRFWRAMAWPALLVTSFVQALVVFTPLGIDVQGNRNWISIGGLTAQPSEAVKIALIIWAAAVFSRKRELLDDWKHAIIPVIPVAIIAIGLVLLGHDLGTVMVMGAILFGCLFYAGIKLRFLVVPVIGGLAVFAAFALSSENRMRRIASFFAESCTDVLGTCYQPTQGLWALANGGVFGVGLGNSQLKWSWLPEADNDYIFAIVGEELGLIGALVVVAMFVVLAVVFMRIIRHTDDLFTRVVTGGVMIWIVGQAFLNIGVVVEIFPVLGVPLPLISSGGTALLCSLFAIGIVLSLAREKRPADRGGLRP